MTDKVEATEEKVESVDETKLETIDAKEFAEIKAENERLKAFHDKVTQEKQQAVAKAKAEADKAAKDKAAAEGDYKQLLELQKSEYQLQIEELKNKINSYEQSNKEKLINDTAMKLASELAKSSTKKAETLGNILKSRLKLTDDGVKVIDAKGNIISEKLEVLADFAKKEYDFLCDGLQSTGGAGVAVVKPTGAENRTPMNPVDRMNKGRGIETKY